ncbi:MAG: restriction endonuclease [Deltaproteobacteria bacterium]|nr:restriction endonuclease [Deltaproteobacteria bacterium]
MPQVKPYLQHLKSSKGLVTTYEETRSGFIALALERNRRSTPFVEQARALKLAATKSSTPIGLLRLTDIQPALLTAAGVSDKAAKYLTPEDRQEAIKKLIANYLEPAGSAYVEELVFRFLLTRGDTLGGSMRNLGGLLAERRVARAIIAGLALAGKPYQWFDARSKKWINGTEEDADIELDLKGLSWVVGKRHRTMLYNRKVKLVGNNVDLCLLNCRPGELSEDILNNPALYLALGELKGGIDPAGADEHWKTASKALARIKKCFWSKGFKPDTFFVGAAIQSSMAKEIWAELEDGTLSNAANLTDANQVVSLCRWLCAI